MDNFDELDAMRLELAAIKENLDKSKIINESLLRKVMKQRTGWLNGLVTAELIVYPVLVLFYYLLCLFLGMSQWFTIAMAIVGAIDIALDFRTVRISPLTFSTANLIDIQKLIVRHKKERNLQLGVMFPLLMVWMVLFLIDFVKSFLHKFGIETNEEAFRAMSIGMAVTGVVAIIVVLWLHRKMHRTSNALLSDLDQSNRI